MDKMTRQLPVMIFDGECRFCRRWIARWRRRTKGRVRYIAFQKLGERFPFLPRDACENAVQLITIDGTIISGADAIIWLFELGLPGGRLVRLLLSHPPAVWVMRLGYGLVARNRRFLSEVFGDRRLRSRRRRTRNSLA